MAAEYQPETDLIPSGRKTRAGNRRQQTIYLPTELARWLKVHAAETEVEMSQIVATALERYRQQLTEEKRSYE
jgi:hypothetical protein